MNEEQIRAEFENWWKQELLTKHGLTIDEINIYCKRSPEGDYVHATTAMRWEGWQAALSAKSVPDGYVLVPIEIISKFPELNLSNYSYEDIVNINEWGIEVCQAAPPLPTDDERVRELEAKYNELIMAVARKFPNESRHETALRYINEAEVVNEKEFKAISAMSGEPQ